MFGNPRRKLKERLDNLDRTLEKLLGILGTMYLFRQNLNEMTKLNDTLENFKRENMSVKLETYIAAGNNINDKPMYEDVPISKVVSLLVKHLDVELEKTPATSESVQLKVKRNDNDADHDHAEG